ncbi:Lin1244/Lin1753 domain-containing protein [Olsenella sp. Marseille-P4559]|uniref:Lin1244/Lin1753 domain-containing protein n=1 Tax=Olsenella sp. Marseille-P4559 TaxID=2364795 RepID=UPI001030E98D|nr:Lin1244/Lin1753 domain-containing protein [Olsenella sp. Marseille-P4559]
MAKLATDAVAALALKPMKFFPHDSNASADIKCQRLIRRMGYEGYGRWWRLCEHLAASDGHTVPFSTAEDKLILGGILGFDHSNFEEVITIEETTAFVDCLFEIGLLNQAENGELYSKRMFENSLYFGRKRAGGRMGGRPRKNSDKEE